MTCKPVATPVVRGLFGKLRSHNPNPAPTQTGSVNAPTPHDELKHSPKGLRRPSRTRTTHAASRSSARQLLTARTRSGIDSSPPHKHQDPAWPLDRTGSRDDSRELKGVAGAGEGQRSSQARRRSPQAERPRDLRASPGWRPARSPGDGTGHGRGSEATLLQRYFRHSNQKLEHHKMITPCCPLCTIRQADSICAHSPPPSPSAS